MEEECEVAYIFAIENYKAAIKEMFLNRDNSPVDSIELFSMFKRAREIGMQEFKVMNQIRDKFQNYGDYLEKLQKYINDQEQTLIEINENIAKQLAY